MYSKNCKIYTFFHKFFFPDIPGVVTMGGGRPLRGVCEGRPRPPPPPTALRPRSELFLRHWRGGVPLVSTFGYPEYPWYLFKKLLFFTCNFFLWITLGTICTLGLYSWIPWLPLVKTNYLLSCFYSKDTFGYHEYSWWVLSFVYLCWTTLDTKYRKYLC